jgi:glycine cleavage system regulatory protein
MTVIGQDRTGLVESVARLVAEHGGNWLESRMCRLGGEFAGILRVHVPTEKRAGLEGALGKLPGLTVVIRSDAAGDAAEKKQLASCAKLLERWPP